MSRKSRKRRRQKRLASLLLIIVALVLIGGVAVYMLHGKNTDASQSLVSNVRDNVSQIKSTSDNSSSSSSDNQSNEDSYESLLSGTGTMSFSYYFSNESKAVHESSSDYELFSNLSKQEYTLPELVDELNKIFTDPNGWYMGNEISGMEYSYLDCGNDGNKELAIRFTCPIVEQESTLTMILKEMDGKIQLVHSFDQWSRCEASINEYGFCSSGGSDGAAVHVIETGYVDASGKFNYGYCEYDYSEVDAFGDSYEHTDYDTSSIDGIIEIFTLRTKPATMDDYEPQYFAYSIYDNGNDTTELYKSGPYKDLMDSFTNIDFMSYDEMLKLETSRTDEIGATSDIISANQLEFSQLKL